MPAVRVDGIEVAYDRVGRGPPLVLAHGATTDARLFRPQTEDLGDEFTVVAWDEPGAGRSSDVPPSLALADYTRCPAAVVEDVDLGPAHVLGPSWGGTVVLELYRHHAELVRTLLLADTSGLRLIDTLIDVAADPSSDGYACQVIAATIDPLPRPYADVRETPVDTDNRFFDHAPARLRCRCLQAAQHRRAVHQPPRTVARPGHTMRQTRHRLPGRTHLAAILIWARR